MKSTLVVIHVLPNEMDMFVKFFHQYKRSLLYLDEGDDVTLYATLNLNPLLVNWNESSLPYTYYINLWRELFDKFNGDLIQQIELGETLLGTTQQKREAIELDFDDFIFVDSDIVFPEQLLKQQLNASKLITNSKYIISPNTIKLWDNTWDVLTHKDFLNKDFNYYKTHKREDTIEQEIKSIVVREIETLKFGCGMHTLYSKTFWDLVGIPHSFGGYGPEDTFGMFAGESAKLHNQDIKQYLLDGVYISEDYVNRGVQNEVVMFDKKEEFRKMAEANFGIELEIFKRKL